MTNSLVDQARSKVEGALTLVVARRAGKNLKGYRLPMHVDVQAELQTVCRQTLDQVGARRGIPYSDDLTFNSGEEYVQVPRNTLVAHRPQRKRARAAQIEVDAAGAVEVDANALKVLSEAASLPELAAQELARQAFLFYAVVAGDSPEDRVAFVDRWNPYRAGFVGNVLTWFGDRLRRLDGPLLVFERTFDMVVVSEGIVVLDAKAFEAVFRDIDAMAERIPVWSSAAVDGLPVDLESAEAIRNLSTRSARVAAQLRGLFERGAFARKLSINDLRKEMRARELDVGRLVVGGKLHLEEGDIPVVLKLIDEKLYQGWRTGTEWDVGTRARRG